MAAMAPPVSCTFPASKVSAGKFLAKPSHRARAACSRPDQPSQSVVGIGHHAPAQESAFARRLQQHFGDPFDFARRCEFHFLGLPRALFVADQFIQADRHRLPQIHRNIFFASGNAHQPVAVAQVFVRKPEFLRPEKKRHAARNQPLADRARSLFQPLQRVLQRRGDAPPSFPPPACSPPPLRPRSRILSPPPAPRCAHGRARFAKCHFVGIHHAQIAKSEIAHRPRRGPDVQRVSAGDQHHAQTVVGSFKSPRWLILCHAHFSRVRFGNPHHGSLALCKPYIKMVV